MALAHFHHDLVLRWKAALQECGVVRLIGVPLCASNGELRAIGAQLGVASNRALPHRAGLAETGSIARVEAIDVAASDQFGKPLLSASAAAFELHTDESFCSQPARFVLLQCWRADPAGAGVSLFARREQILADADDHSRELFARCALPYPTGNFPVLDARGLLRFNRAECLGEMRARARAASASETQCMEAFALAAMRAAESCTLVAGDLLILDNHRVLHGRTPFNPHSRRLLKRLRILDSG